MDFLAKRKGEQIKTIYLSSERWTPYAVNLKPVPIKTTISFSPSSEEFLQKRDIPEDFSLSKNNFDWSIWMSFEDKVLNLDGVVA